MLTDFQNSYTFGLSNTCVIKSSLRIPSHLNALHYLFFFAPPCSLIARNELRKVLFLALSTSFLSVCAWNISGTAERICAKFTRKTCLVPRSDQFECQGQRSKVKVTRVGQTSFPLMMTMMMKMMMMKIDNCLSLSQKLKTHLFDQQRTSFNAIVAFLCFWRRDVSIKIFLPTYFYDMKYWI